MADQNVPQNVENEQDPGANTQMFRAFVNEGQTEATAEPKLNGARSPRSGWSMPRSRGSQRTARRR